MNNPDSISSQDPGSATTLSPELRRTFTVLLLGGGSLLLLGQNLANIVPEAQRWLTWIFKGFGLIFFALASLGLSGQRTEWIGRILDPPARWLSISAMQFVLLIAAPLFSFGAWLAADDKSLMRDPWIGVGAWVFATVLVIAASRGTAYSFQVRMWPRWEIITVVVFGVIALALRVIYLDKIPWLVGGDEGAFGLGSLDILNGVANNIFGTDRFSYPRLYFAIPALAIAPLGNTIFALRLSSAVGGCPHRNCDLLVRAPCLQPRGGNFGSCIPHWVPLPYPL